MAQTRIEQLIEEIYAFIEGCKMQPLSQTKVIVPKDELYDLLDELRLRTPDEIKRYQKIIANRDSIIAQAEERARQIEAEAREHVKKLVNENEIMQQAYYQANEMVQTAKTEAENLRRSAEQDAEQIRTGALAYTNDILIEVDHILSVSYRESKELSEKLVNSLKNNLDTLHENQTELRQQINGEEDMPGTTDADENPDDFDFPEDTFLNDID